MSHYICGMEDYNKDNETENYKVLAELRYNAFNKRNYIIYSALDAMEHYQGVSGDGETVEYTKQDIENAIAELDKVKTFLETLKNSKNKYIIGWW